MTARIFNPHKHRGAIALSRLLPIIVIVVVLVAAAGWFLTRGGGSGTAGHALVPGVKTAAAPAVATAPVEELSVDQLYQQARAAMGSNRMVAPPGNNALEYYLKILAKEPNNNGAADALRELFPFATGAVEQDINQGNLDEANRVMDLLAKADPSNYTLTILRSKLDAKKKQIDQQAAVAAAAAAKQQQAAAAAQTAAAGAANTPVPAAATETPAKPAAAPAPSLASATPAPVEAKPAPTPVAPSTGESHDVELVKQAAPDYPVQAARSQQEGWVDVEFTVAADGSVQNAKVVGAEPARVFNSAAVAAIRRSTFKPRVANGQAVSATLHRRIEFKLNR